MRITLGNYHVEPQSRKARLWLVIIKQHKLVKWQLDGCALAFDTVKRDLGVTSSILVLLYNDSLPIFINIHIKRFAQ